MTHVGVNAPPLSKFIQLELLYSLCTVVWALLYVGSMLGGLTAKTSLKSRRAMLDTLLRTRNMVRLSLGALAALSLLGCSGLIDEGEGDSSITPEEKAARQLFVSTAKPILDTSCASCHSGSDPSVAFLSGADPMAVRTTLLGFDPKVVNLEAPTSSRLLTKGAHSGPAFLASQASELIQWVQAERDAANVDGPGDLSLATEPFSPLLCTGGDPGSPTCPINIVDLSPLVTGWAGAQIKFVAQPLGTDLYVTNLQLITGAEGVYIEHPLFVSWPNDGSQPLPDTLDRFFNIKMNLKVGDMPASIGGGTAAFINFNPQNKLTINFKILEKYREETGGGGGGMTAMGCKQVASFTANARGPLQTSCGGCHAAAANTNARGAMDITGIANAADATVMQNVCNQTRTRINFADTNQSGFFIAPNPAMQTNHPFKFGGNQANFDTFKAAVDIWVQAEKTSQ